MHLREHLEAAATALAARGVARVREELELGEDEPRHHERAADEARAHDVGDPTVDDHRGVEEHASAAAAILAATSHLTDGALKVGALDRPGRHTERAEHDCADERREPA